MNRQEYYIIARFGESCAESSLRGVAEAIHFLIFIIDCHDFAFPKSRNDGLEAIRRFWIATKILWIFSQ